MNQLRFLEGVRIDDISFENLLLDPDNPRFRISVELDISTRSFEEILALQKDIIKKIQKNKVAYSKLEISLITNGYIKSESIVIQRIPSHEDYYLVREGNRRVAAIKTILNDANKRNQLSENQLRSLKYPPCFLIPYETSKIEIYQMLNARHVVGTKPWGLSERGIAIAELYMLLRDKYPSRRTEDGRTILQDLANKSGISTVQSTSNFLIAVYLQQEVNRFAESNYERISESTKGIISIDELLNLQLDLFIEAARNSTFTNWIHLERNSNNYLASRVMNQENFALYVSYLLKEVITSARNHQRYFFKIIGEEEQTARKLLDRIDFYYNQNIEFVNLPRLVFEDFEKSKPAKSIIALQSFEQFIIDLEDSTFLLYPDLRDKLRDIASMILDKLDKLE